MIRPALLLSLLAACPAEVLDDVDDTGPLEACVADAPPDVLRVPGIQDDGSYLALDGRLASPTGRTTSLAGFATDVVVHPSGRVAYLSTISRKDAYTDVVDLSTGEVVQRRDDGAGFQGVGVHPDGGTVYVAGGDAEELRVHAVKTDGTLEDPVSVELKGMRPTGIAVAADGSRVWVAGFEVGRVVAVDTDTLDVVVDVTPGGETAWLLEIPSRDEIWLSDFDGESLRVLDADDGALLDEIEVGPAPAGLAASSDGATVWTATSRGDELVAIDTTKREVVDRVPVSAGVTGPDGEPLPNANPNDVLYDAARDQVLVAVGKDNAIAVFDAATLSREGAFPAGWYPSGMALAPDDGPLVVVTGKGGVRTPDDAGATHDRGSISVVDLDDVDLAVGEDEVLDAFLNPLDAFGFTCDGRFPIPQEIGGPSPIEHVVLIVKENKTFDCLLGYLEGANGEPDLLRYPPEATVNLEALSKRFSISDNFYVDTENSDSGHTFLTSTHLTDYVERLWHEDVLSGEHSTYPTVEASNPLSGNWFTHLMDLGIDLRIYGEIVGMFIPAADGSSPFEHSDQAFPNRPFINYEVPDVEKAQYVADRIAEGELATFTYLLLPNDHGVGTTPGQPTPESMVADNDAAVGIVVDALSKAPTWDSTAVFILQDDPQGCSDHVDDQRSFVIVASPYARRGHISHARANYLSVFATIERLLGIPPMGRNDATAAPLWDMFQADADLEPFDALERALPVEINSASAFGAELSQQLDLRSPDRDPRLTLLYDAYLPWRRGHLTRAEAEALLLAGLPDEDDDPRWEEVFEEAEEESTAFDASFARYRAWLEARGQPVPTLGLSGGTVSRP